MKIRLFTISLLFIAYIAQGAAINSVQSGSWSDPATWGGTAPTAGDDVTVSATHTVTLPGFSFNWSSGSITILGTLNGASLPNPVVFSGTSSVYIANGGDLRVGQDLVLGSTASLTLAAGVCVSVGDDLVLNSSTVSLCGQGSVSIGASPANNRVQFSGGANSRLICLGTTIYRTNGTDCTASAVLIGTGDRDSDGDGVFDALDEDSDNDGISDTDEGAVCTGGGATTLDWTVDTWPTSTLNNSYTLGANTLDIQVSDPSSMITTISTSAGLTSGAGEAFTTIVDSDSRESQVQYSFDFASAISDLSFNIYHVNRNGDNSSIDSLIITGYENGRAVMPFLTGGSSMSINGNEILGIAQPTGASSTLNVTFLNAIDSISIIFGNGSEAPDNPGSHGFAIYDLTINTGGCMGSDKDRDGIPDFRDLDSDGDGIPDLVEAGGADANQDGILDVINPNGTLVNDVNGDGFDDALAATGLPRPDTDGDGFANHLDLDSDGDGIADVTEAAGATNASADTNGDGLADGGVGANGLPSSVDPSAGGTPLELVNTDGLDETTLAMAVLPDYLDIDTDNDGIIDMIESQSTPAYTLPQNSDLDSDGIDDQYDAIFGPGGGTVPVNTDNADADADYRDLDSDDDGESDLIEAYDEFDTGAADILPDGRDTDGDGLDDAYDLNDIVTDPTTNSSNNLQVVISFPNFDSGNLERNFRYNPTVLPIELVSFSAKEANDCSVLLTWETSTEIDNDYFRLQRSSNGTDFTTVTVVEGAGTSSEAVNYQYLDTKPEAVNYYRLLQVDLDGTITPSDIVFISLNCNVIPTEISNLYPNLVFNNDINIVMSSSDNRAGSIRVRNTLGQTVVLDAIHMEAGTNQFTFNPSQLSAGTYFLSIEGSDFRTPVQRFVKYK